LRIDVTVDCQDVRPAIVIVVEETRSPADDNDGWPDILAVNGHVYPQMENASVGTTYRQRILLFHNQRDRTFAEVAAESGAALMTPRVSRGLAFADLDNDGFIDVAINNLDGKPTILHNDGATRNNWISIKLVGNGKNRDAIGARAKVVSGDLIQWDETHAGGSYLSSSDPRLHYGLGKKSRVDSIEIHWPDGRVETVKDVSVNRFLTIEEGKGVTRALPPPAAKQN